MVLLPSVTVTIGAPGKGQGNKKKSDSSGLDCTTSKPSKDSGSPVQSCDNGVAGTTAGITATAPDNGAIHGNKKKSGSGLDCIAPAPSDSTLPCSKLRQRCSWDYCWHYRHSCRQRGYSW